MLTPDHVVARRKKDKLELVPLGARREAALAIAESTIALAKEHVGRTRAELEEAWAAIDAEPRDRKLADGIRKLVDDALVFESGALGLDPVELRADLFGRAAIVRRNGSLDRDALVAEVAASRGIAAAELERGLYADLKGAQVLREATAPPPRAIVDGWDLAQAQAALLRATRVVAHLSSVDPQAVRALFRKLKFLRLLCTVHAEGDGWRLELDGPFSLFDSVTKYGLALALALPAIAACGRHRVVADVRWGKERLPLRLELEGERRAPDEVPARLSDDAESLRARLEAADGEWRVAISDAILDVPGVGVCVPDLVLTHRKTRKKVHVEVLGYWSRDAVWKRVEMAERGLRERVLFCASERLRVSEAVLDAESAALLVYKGVIPLGALEEKAARLAAR